MSKQFWAIIAIIILVFGGILYFNDSKKTPSTSASPSNHVEGQDADHVTLLEYGDYECPYCGEYYPTVKQVVQQYSADITFQFRNLPLSSIHPNAFAGARAAEAASLQGKFWQMHDALYENQDAWVSSSDPETYFDSYAQQLGLNVSKFESDFSSEQVNDTINADIAAFGKTGAEEATPTFFLDGKQISPANTASAFESLINAEIAKKTGKPATS